MLSSGDAVPSITGLDKSDVLGDEAKSGVNKLRFSLQSD